MYRKAPQELVRMDFFLRQLGVHSGSQAWLELLHSDRESEPFSRNVFIFVVSTTRNRGSWGTAHKCALVISLIEDGPL